MLYAIESNKAGRNINGDVIHWRQFFKTSEDSLTSFIFERLFYLPSELMWFILRESCKNVSLPSHCSAILYKEFWPKWDAANTNNSNFVEPDVFIRFEAFDLLIEAKRWDLNQQNTHQWAAEIQAYKNEHGGDKHLYFIALGGLNNETLTETQGVTLLKCQWKDILATVQDMLAIISETSNLLSSNQAVKQILEDLILAFSLHGYSTGKWFEKWKVKHHLFPHYDNSIALFQQLPKFSQEK